MRLGSKRHWQRVNTKENNTANYILLAASAVANSFATDSGAKLLTFDLSALNKAYPAGVSNNTNMAAVIKCFARRVS